MPAIIEIREGTYKIRGQDVSMAGNRFELVEQYRDGAISTYALLKDGVWYVKGEMGWWGMSNDKMSQGEWNAQVAKLLDELPDDTRITIVDCHI